MIKKNENKHYIHFLFLKLYNVSIFNLFGRLNTFCRKQLFHVYNILFLCKITWITFFSFFKSIKGILHKTPFYNYNICNLNKEENSAKKVTFSMFFSYFHLLVEENQKNPFLISTIFFFSKIAQTTYFYAFILFLRQDINFSLKPHKRPFFQCFSEIYNFSRKTISFTKKNMILQRKSFFQ